MARVGDRRSPRCLVSDAGGHGGRLDRHDLLPGVRVRGVSARSIRIKLAGWLSFRRTASAAWQVKAARLKPFDPAKARAIGKASSKTEGRLTWDLSCVAFMSRKRQRKPSNRCRGRQDGQGSDQQVGRVCAGQSPPGQDPSKGAERERAHADGPEVAGSNPAPATNRRTR